MEIKVLASGSKGNCLVPRSVHWGATLPVGSRFGRLVIVREDQPVYWRKFRKRRFLCRCDCGREVIIHIYNLKLGHTRSCGCLKVEHGQGKRTHGDTSARLYQTWRGMLNRCRNNNVKSYKYYGAMGVRVCDEWLRYEPFRDWAIRHGYQAHLTIDRVNPFGNYEPTNCRWATRLEQRHSRRDCFNASVHTVCLQ